MPPIAIPYDVAIGNPLPTYKVEIVLDYKASADPKVIDRYFVKWENKPESKNSWI